MGIIIRQVTKRSLVNYIGVGIGAISVLFIYSRDEEAYGLIQFILSMAALLVPFAGLGVNTLVVRFFPAFKDTPSQHHGFLGFLVTYALIALTLFMVIVTLFEAPFLKVLETLKFNVPLFQDNFLFIGLILFSLVFSNILEAFSSNFNRIVIPSMLTNLLQKLALPVIVLLFLSGILSLYSLRLALTGISFLSFLGLIWYVRSLGQLHLRLEPSHLTPSLFRQMGTYALFGILSSLAGTLPFRIDTIMVAAMISTKENGIYSISNFIVNTIEIPYLAIVAIASPIIASAFQRHDYEEISVLYRKGSLNLLIGGLLIFLLVWISIHDLLRLTSNYESLVRGVGVVFILGLTKTITMSFGLSNYIIDLSRFYRFNFFNLLITATMNVGLNFILIPKHGILGAATATAISLLAMNFTGVLFTAIRLKMHPFTWKTLSVVGLASAVYFSSFLFPKTPWPLANIALNSAIVVVEFVLPLLLFRVSPDLNRVFGQVKERFLRMR